MDNKLGSERKAELGLNLPRGTPTRTAMCEWSNRRKSKNHETDLYTGTSPCIRLHQT